MRDQMIWYLSGSSTCWTSIFSEDTLMSVTRQWDPLNLYRYHSSVYDILGLIVNGISYTSSLYSL